MEGEFLQISKINDFLFCPLSIYFHGIYENFDQKIYHATPQTEGKINHENIESKKYTSSRNILQGTAVFSSEYGIVGKIDLFNTQTGELVERKTKIKRVYAGHRAQLYAQAICLRERGIKVRKMTIRSLKNNKKFLVPILSQKEEKRFGALVCKIKNFQPEKNKKVKNQKKCQECIYANLCF
jgi:CRISPR-associated protein Cas4